MSNHSLVYRLLVPSSGTPGPSAVHSLTRTLGFETLAPRWMLTADEVLAPVDDEVNIAAPVRSTVPACFAGELASGASLAEADNLLAGGRGAVDTPTGGTVIDPEVFRQRGLEVAQEIEATLRLAGSTLYAESGILGGGQSSPVGGKAYLWPSTTQFRALNSLARLDLVTADHLEQFVSELDTYYRSNKPGGGYSSDGVGGSGPRFWDDNSHLLVALMEAYEITDRPLFLQRAREVMDFQLLGEDAQGGGGIYFCDCDMSFKDPVGTIQTVRGSLMLYRATGQEEYLEHAERLYTWIRTRAQASDGLIYGRVYLDGSVDTLGLANGIGDYISASVLFYDVTGDAAHLTEARRVAARSITRYTDAASGRINDEGFWAFELLDAWLNLYERDRDPLWLEVARAVLDWLHANKADPNGHYDLFWGRGGVQTDVLGSWDLNDMAPVARAYLRLATIENSLPSLPTRAYTVASGGLLNVRAEAGLQDGIADSEGDSLVTLLLEGAANGDVVVAADGSFVYTAVAGYEGTDTFTYGVQDHVGTVAAVVTIDVVAVDPVRVAGVDVGSTTWTAPFAAALADRGQGIGAAAIASGAGQLQPVVWNGVDQIRVRFDQSVEVAADALQVFGVNQPAISAIDFAYDDQAHTATWTFAPLARADKLLLVLSGVHGPLGTPLDGNWQDGVSSFPSGNGVLETDDSFAFRLNVLVGDANATGQVDRADLAGLIARLGTVASSTRYDPRWDPTGEGRITGADLRLILALLSNRLPAGSPLANVAPPLPATDAVFERVGTGAGQSGTLLASIPKPPDPAVAWESEMLSSHERRPSRVSSAAIASEIPDADLWVDGLAATGDC